MNLLYLKLESMMLAVMYTYNDQPDILEYSFSGMLLCSYYAACLCTFDHHCYNKVAYNVYYQQQA